MSICGASATPSWSTQAGVASHCAHQHPSEAPRGVPPYSSTHHLGHLRHNGLRIRPELTSREPHDWHTAREQQAVSRSVALEGLTAPMELPSVKFHHHRILDHQVHPPHTR